MNYQRKDLKTGADIGPPGPLPDDLAGGLTDTDLARLGDLGPAKAYEGVGFVRVADPVAQPDPASRTISTRTFIRRLTFEEMVGVETLAVTDLAVRVYLRLLAADTTVELDAADTAAGLDYLVSLKLITAERAAELRA